MGKSSSRSDLKGRVLLAYSNKGLSRIRGTVLKVSNIRSSHSHSVRVPAHRFGPVAFLSVEGDILGPFPVAPGQLKFLIVAVDYFTKWVEAEAVSRISADRVRCFYWRSIIFQFELPRVIVSDNGAQFASASVVEFCKELGIQNKFISVEHPQANGQAESAN